MQEPIELHKKEMVVDRWQMSAAALYGNFFMDK
jgi:hypothetical protein